MSLSVTDTVYSHRSRGNLSQPVPPTIADWQQLGGSSYEELLARQYQLPEEPDTENKLENGSISSSSGALSVSGTMASSIRMGSTASGNVPSLDRSIPSRSSSSIGTSVMITPRDPGSPAFPGHIMAPRTQPTGVLQCAFAFLGCTEQFLDKREWTTHSASHFRTSQPPSRAQCPFCDARWTSPRELNPWSARMDHIAEHHRRERLEESSRADCDLYLYLWDIRAIDSIQYQELVWHRWCDVTSDNYTEMHDPRRDRRMGVPQGYTTRRT